MDDNDAKIVFTTDLEDFHLSLVSCIAHMWEQNPIPPGGEACIGRTMIVDGLYTLPPIPGAYGRTEPLMLIIENEANLKGLTVTIEWRTQPCKTFLNMGLNIPEKFQDTEYALQPQLSYRRLSAIRH